MAVAIVAGPLLRMAEDLEGLGGFLELDDGLVVARIAVGMILQRQLAVGLGDLRLRGVSRHAQALRNSRVFPPSLPWLKLLSVERGLG